MANSIKATREDRPRRSYLQHTATAKVSREEQKELETAAKAQGKSVSAWAREVLLGHAREPIIDPVFTELVATRMLLNSMLRRITCGEVITPETFNSEMQMIRTTKHKMAREVMQQYASPEAGR